MWPHNSILEPEDCGRYSSHSTQILLPSQRCLPWSKTGRNSSPQTLSHNLCELVVPGLSILNLLPILNSSALPPTLFPSKTTLNLILITAKTKRVFVCNPVRRLFGEMSVADKGNAVLKSFERFSGSMSEEVARGWAVLHYSSNSWWPAATSYVFPGQSNLSLIPKVILRIVELACSKSVEFPMRYREGSRSVTVLISLRNSLYFDMHCLKINVWNWRYYH